MILAIASAFVQFIVAVGVFSGVGVDRLAKLYGLAKQTVGSDALVVLWTRRGPEWFLLMGGALRGATALSALRIATLDALCIATWGFLRWGQRLLEICDSDLGFSALRIATLDALW
jgi:hypothetical protein